jgi:hypothetical protein
MLKLSGNLTVEAASVINSDLSTDANWETSGSITGGSLATGTTVIATGVITGAGFKSPGFTGAGGLVFTDNIPGNWSITDGSSVFNVTGASSINQGVKTTDSPTFGGVTTTGTVDASGGKVRVRDDAAVKPSAESDGYISVYEDGATRRIYTFVGGSRYYVTLTADVDVAVGNPIGLLLALTYAA